MRTHRENTAPDSEKARTNPLLAWIESQISSGTKRNRTGRFAQRYDGCRVPACKAHHWSKGFCRRHYEAFRREEIDADGIPDRKNRDVMGAHLREFRQQQNWNQERFADLLGITKSRLQTLESYPNPVPDMIADRFNTVRRGVAAGAIKLDTEKPRRHFHNGRSVTARGKIRPTERKLSRDPRLEKYCSRCGRLRQVDRRPRYAIGGNVVTLRCVPLVADPADQRHDPPQRFIERNGKILPLTDVDADKLRSRRKTAFEVRCARADCPRRSKRMERAADLGKSEKNGEIVKLAMYACRPLPPAIAHYEYRVLPHGEVAQPIVDSAGKRLEGRYRWTDADGEVHQTVRKRRAIRKDRVMPAAECRRDGCALIPRRGPWHNRHVKYWSAECPKCGKRWYVDKHGSVSEPAKGGRTKLGRKPGKLSEDTDARTTIAAYLRLLDPHTTVYSMAATLFPEQNLKDAAYDNAKRLFQRHKKQIERERVRLKALSPQDREHEVERAKQRLSV